MHLRIMLGAAVAYGAAIAMVAILLPITPAWAQEPVPVANATFVETPPLIDGIVDDAVWEVAVPITGFVQTEPVEGTPASEETVVRILYNNRAIFISVICYDSEPDQIRVTDSRRDSGMNDTDSFQVIFDTYHDLQNGFVFGTNPAGIEFDGQVSNEGEGTRAVQGRAAVTSGSRLQSKLGHQLDGAHRSHRIGLDGRVRNPIEKPSLWGPAPNLGRELSTQYSPEERRGVLGPD